MLDNKMIVDPQELGICDYCTSDWKWVGTPLIWGLDWEWETDEYEENLWGWEPDEENLWRLVLSEYE